MRNPNQTSFMMGMIISGPATHIFVVKSLTGARLPLCDTKVKLKHAMLYPDGNRRMSIRRNNRGHGRLPQHNSDERQPTRQRATDQEIQKWILRQHGFVPESGWLLHCKELFGLTEPGSAPTENPCPPEKVATIKQAFRRFGLL